MSRARARAGQASRIRAAEEAFKAFVREELATELDAAVAHVVLNTVVSERSMNKAHPSAPKHIREMAVPTTTPVGGIRAGLPPPGLFLCLQAGSDVWKWWYVTPGPYHDAWCLEEDQGGARAMSRICNWLEPDEDKK